MTSALPRVLLLTDWSLGEARVLQAAEEALSLGPEVGLQHRAPGAPARLFLEQARALASVCRRHRAPLFINGRLDVAKLVGAHLHLPAGGLLPGEVRPHLGKDRWVSIAVHDAAEAEQGRGADLALVSPVFPAGSKAADTRRPLGPSGFAELRAHLCCPAYALGGISQENLPLLPRPAGVAVVTQWLSAPRPKDAVAGLLAALRG